VTTWKNQCVSIVDRVEKVGEWWFAYKQATTGFDNGYHLFIHCGLRGHGAAS
jgi:hypothetical protein